MVSSAQRLYGSGTRTLRLCSTIRQDNADLEIVVRQIISANRAGENAKRTLGRLIIPDIFG